MCARTIAAPLQKWHAAHKREAARPAPPAVNVNVIDGQHAVPIENKERLEQAMANGQDTTALSQLIRDFDAYTRHHFPTEERLMESYAYPLRDMHALEHEKGLRQAPRDGTDGNGR